MNISTAWGYGVVIVPRKLFWQGFVILDPDRKDLQSSIVHAENLAKWGYQASGQEPTEDQVFGSLQSALVECLTGEVDYAEGKAAIFSAAISKHSGRKYWIIDATEEEHGTTTSFVPLEVHTAEAARNAINHRVMPLKMGHVINVMGKGK